MQEQMVIAGIQIHADEAEPYPRVNLRFLRAGGSEVWGTLWLRGSSSDPPLDRLRKSLGTNDPCLDSLAFSSLTWCVGMAVSGRIFKDRRGAEAVNVLSLQRDDCPFSDSVRSILREDASEIDEIRRAIEHLHPDGKTFEVRRLPKMGRGVVAGHFRDPSIAAMAVAIADRFNPGASYISTCELDLSVTNGFGFLCNSWQHTITLRWLLVDVDPLKAGSMATDMEREHAALASERLIDWLKQRGFPQPAVIDSGNGRQLLYPCEIEATDESRDLVDSFLHGLAHQFNTPDAQIDVAVGNTPPQCRLPATWNRKGDDTEAWRKSALLTPATGQAVTKGMLEAFVEYVPAESIPRRNGKARHRAQVGNGESSGTFDFTRYFEEYGIAYYRTAKGFEVRCPFHSHRDQQHGPSSKTMAWQDANGVLCFKCLSSKCNNFGWPEFREKVGPPQRQHFLTPIYTQAGSHTLIRVASKSGPTPKPQADLERELAEASATFEKSISQDLEVHKAILTAIDSPGCMIQVPSDEASPSPSMLSDIQTLIVASGHEECEIAAARTNGTVAPSRNGENCRKLDDCQIARKLGLSPGSTVCPNCEFFAGCDYIRARDAAKSAQIVVEPAQRFYLAPSEFSHRQIAVISSPVMQAIAPPGACTSEGATEVLQVLKTVESEYSTQDVQEELFLRAMNQFASSVANGPPGPLVREFGSSGGHVIPRLYAAARKLPLNPNVVEPAMQLAVAFAQGRLRDVVIRPDGDAFSATVTWQVPIPEKTSVVLLDHMPLRKAVERAYPGRWAETKQGTPSLRGWIQWPVDLPKATCRNRDTVKAAYQIARAMLPTGRLLLVSHREVATYAKKHRDEFPGVVEAIHFHSPQRKLWALDSRFDSVVVLGTPRPNFDNVRARLVQLGELTEASGTSDWDAAAGRYWDPCWQQAYEAIVLGELTRIHRLADGRPVLAVTNEDLPDATRNAWGMNPDGSLATKSIGDLLPFLEPTDWIDPVEIPAYQRELKARNAAGHRERVIAHGLAGLIDWNGKQVRVRGV